MLKECHDKYPEATYETLVSAFENQLSFDNEKIGDEDRVQLVESIAVFIDNFPAGMPFKILLLYNYYFLLSETTNFSF